MSSDTEYLRGRIEHEREAAARAIDKQVRARHLELAAEYVFHLREVEAQECRSAIIGTGSFAGPLDSIWERPAERADA
jgi:hypothetical protein